MKKNGDYFIWSVFVFLSCVVTSLIFTTCEIDNTEKTEQYTVTFHANGGTGTVPEAQTVNVGTGITLPSGDGLTMDNYSFEGWNTNSDGSGTTYTVGPKYYGITGNITLYAKWEIPTVTFHANGGSGTVPEAQTVNAGTSITLPSGDGLTKTNSKFDGWNTTTSGSGTNYAVGSSYTVNNNVTLYAKWSTLYTVSYSSGSSAATGTPPEPHKVTSGSLISLRNNTFTRDGWRFNGWYSPNVTVIGGGSSYLQPYSSVIVNGNITFTAMWTPQ